MRRLVRLADTLLEEAIGFGILCGYTGLAVLTVRFLLRSL